MTETESAYGRVVIAETNSVHYAWGYLRYAQEHELAPFGGQANWQEIKALLPAQLSQGYRDNLRRGYRTLGFLQQLFDDEATILVSPFTQLELLHGLLEGRAHQRLAEARTPYRMRQRLGDLTRLVNFHLRNSDAEEVLGDIDNMMQVFREVIGNTVEVARKERDLREILAICRVIQSMVFMDPMDCLIYGNSLIVEAETIVSNDVSLREIVNKIEAPATESNSELRPLWETVQRRLRGALAEIIAVPVEEIVLPQAPGVPADSVVRPQASV
ncbi:MAG: hypothetical protein ACE5JQ_00870 [Candidatus Methylomirabilales bacterium]